MKKKSIKISLTGQDSHTVTTPLDLHFYIGAIGMNAKEYDVLVDESLPINWDSITQLEENIEPDQWGRKHRFQIFHYSGNDSNFSKWSEKRKIDSFNWSPLRPVSIDLSNSNINYLTFVAGNHKINVKPGCGSFSLRGKIENINIESLVEQDGLSLWPDTDKKSKIPYQLPIINSFYKLTEINVVVSSIGQPFDCKSLLQFKNLTTIRLNGNLTNLKYLEHFDLERLEIRYAPNLENLPPLKSWNNLKAFIGWNIEESKGKMIRKELKLLAKERTLDYSTSSQLRKPIWFTTEYGMPFSAWEGKNAKTAVKHYNATLKKLKKVETEKEAKKILQDFAKVFNDLPLIETSEREDISEAVYQLRQIPSFEIDEEKADRWFDEVRDY